MNKITLTIVLLVFTLQTGISNNLQITNLSWNEITKKLRFDISYDNSFHVTNYHWYDFAYVFIKYKNATGNEWQQYTFDRDTAVNSISSGASVRLGTINIGSNGDYLGWKTLTTPPYNGTVSETFEIALENPNITLRDPSFKVFGIEMIMNYVQGYFPYYLGDGGANSRYHNGSNSLQPFYFSGSGTVTVGSGNGQLSSTTGDLSGVVSFNGLAIKAPNSCMKYEISQQQYVDFLNCLTRVQQNQRTATNIDNPSGNYYVMTNSSVVLNRNGVKMPVNAPVGAPIEFYCDLNENDIPNEYYDGQNIAMNYLSGQDLYAYLDWAGLVPINEMQYEFLCRADNYPQSLDLAWGTSGYNAAAPLQAGTEGSPDEVMEIDSLVGPIRISNIPYRVGYAATSNSNRLYSGSGPFGSMNLSDNVGEIVKKLNDPADFIVYSSYLPDGYLDQNGNSDAGWGQKIEVRGIILNAGGFPYVYPISDRSFNAGGFSSRSSQTGGRGYIYNPF